MRMTTNNWEDQEQDGKTKYGKVHRREKGKKGTGTTNKHLWEERGKPPAVEMPKDDVIK
jgi:hypothetical protein